MIKHRFHDKDIECVRVDENNIATETVELLIKPGTEAIVLSQRDVLALELHFINMRDRRKKILEAGNFAPYSGTPQEGG